MVKQLGSMPFCEEYAANDRVGHWVIEKDPGKEPRMYADDVMLGLIGLTEQTDPETTFRAWLAGIDRDYMDSVMETERLNVKGIRAEVVYPWHYPDGHTILIRCEGIRNFGYKDGIRTEGRHKDITDYTRMHKGDAVITALASDFECVVYVILHEKKEDDVTISFRTSERMKKFIPQWDDTVSFHDRLSELIDIVGYAEDREKFYALTRREVILEHLESEPAYFVNGRAVVEDGKTEYFQLKFMADRDEFGKIIGIIIGIHTVDDEMREELELRDRVERMVAEKTDELRKKNGMLSKVTQHIIKIMGEIVEGRDEESGKHVGRVSYLTSILGMQVMKDLPEYGLTVEDVSLIASLSPLHDVGKVKIPDRILQKPGKLTPEEFEIMKTHCDKGCEILSGMKDVWSEKSAKISMDICRYHHEKWDGKGYPCGLAGDDIPIWAQIVSIADVYDALVSERCYKRAYSHEEACRMITGGECGKYSDKLLSCFTKCCGAFTGSTAYADRTGEESGISLADSRSISGAVPLIEEIAQSMPGGFFIYQADEDEKLIYSNDIMADYFGCGSKEEFIEYIGNSFKGIVHPEDYRAVEGEIRNQIMSGRRQLDHVVYRIITKDGGIRWLDDYGRLIKSGDMGDVFFVFVRDFTDTYLRKSRASVAEMRNDPQGEKTRKAVLKDLRVLLTDDSDLVRSLGRELLEEEGAVVTEASNGLEAVEEIKRNRDYDLILMDLVMPVMNGVTAIREIKRILAREDRDITVICLTAEGSDMQIKDALEAGAYDCLYKPLSVSELSLKVISDMRERNEKQEQKD